MIQHYNEHGSASPEWLRACREIEAACDFVAAPVSPAPQPLPVPELEAA